MKTKKDIIKTCEYCGNKFPICTLYLYKYKVGPRYYCSYNCMNKSEDVKGERRSYEKIYGVK